MFDDNSESSGFKVVDRRPFAEDGLAREVDEKKNEPAPAPATPSAPAAMQDESFSGKLGEELPTGFDSLVSYLSTTALFQLGMLAGPAGEHVPADLESARLTIDLLDVLQEKTQRNLTPDEAKMLEDVLYELRLSFVEVQKRATQKIK